MTTQQVVRTRANREEIVRALRLLTLDGQTIELRVLLAAGAGARSYIFRDVEALTDKAVNHDEDAKGIYITLNPVNPQVTSSTKDSDITVRMWLPIDSDPERPANASSSDAEHAAALERIQAIRTFLTERGWPEPVVADSGNGAHALYRIDLPAKDGGLVERVLKTLDLRFADGRVNIDQTVKNPARIWKLYGTVARKGEDTVERPHRMSRLLSVPEHIQVVTREQLEAVAALLPDKQEATVEHGQTGTALNIAAWLTQHGVEWKTTKQVDGGTLYVLEECPWSEMHSTGPDGAFVIQWPDGKLIFRCHHSHCAERKWSDFREHYEPDAYAVRPAMGSSVGSVADMPAELEFTDTGNAQRLARQYGAGLRYVKQWGWLAYVDGRWQRDGEAHAMQCAKACINGMLREAIETPDRIRRDMLLDHAKRSFNANKLEAMLSLARSEPGIVARVEEFDTNPWLVNVLNGTLDVRTGVLRPHNPDDRITRLAPVVYSPTTTAPRFKRFLAEVFSGDSDLIGFVQRALGYSMTGVTQGQAFFTCWGAGSNGKSTLLNAIARVLGDYAKPLKADALMSSPYKNSSGADPEIASLVGARFVTASEPRGGELDTAKVKELTGGDPMQVRELHKMPFTFVPQFKMWLSTNERPTVTETTTGIWRRIKLIPFTVSFEGRRDETLPEALAAEASGILNWLLEGVRQWQEHGLVEAQAVRDATKEYRDEEDPYNDFFTEVLVRGIASERVELKVAYEAFTSWAQQNEAPLLSDKEFPKRAEARGYHKTRSNGKRWLVGCRLVDRSQGSTSAASADNRHSCTNLSQEAVSREKCAEHPESGTSDTESALRSDIESDIASAKFDGLLEESPDDFLDRLFPDDWPY